jgi:hypothetical protein
MKYTTEKEAIKAIKKEMKDISNLQSEDSYQRKCDILSLMGFNHSGNNLAPEIKDKKFIKREMPEIIEELLCGHNIDLDILQQVVKVQNGMVDMKLTDTMKECLEEGLLSNRPAIEASKNIKKLKYFQDIAEVDNGFFEELEKQSKVLSDYSQITEEDVAEYENQKPVKKSVAGIKTKEEEIELEIQDKESKMEVSWQEEARRMFYERAESLNSIERKYYRDDKSLDKRSNNKIIDSIYENYYDMKRGLTNMFESTSLVQMSKDSNTPLRSIFKYPLIGKGVRFDTFPSPEEAKQVYELAALKVRADGIENPYVYTKKATNVLEHREREAFVRGQINALVEVGYEIEDISVDPEMNSVYDGIKENILKKRSMIVEGKNLVEEAKNATLSPENKTVLLSKIDIEGNIETDNDNSLLAKINNNKKLNEKEVELLEEKIKNGQSHISKFANESGVPLDSDGNKKEMAQEGESLDSNDDFEEETLVAGEQDLLSGPENKPAIKLRKFNDFEGSQGSPEMIEGQEFRNEDTQHVKNIHRKINNPNNKDIRETIKDPELIDLIERKAALIDIHTKGNLSDPEIRLLTKVLNFDRGTTEQSWGALDPNPLEGANGVIAKGFGKLYDYLARCGAKGLEDRPETDYPESNIEPVSKIDVEVAPKSSPIPETSPIPNTSNMDGELENPVDFDNYQSHMDQINSQQNNDGHQDYHDMGSHNFDDLPKTKAQSDVVTTDIAQDVSQAENFEQPNNLNKNENASEAEVVIKSPVARERNRSSIVK